MFLYILPILIVSLITVGAQLLLKRGVLDLGALNFSISDFIALAPKIPQNIWLMCGVVLFGISFLFWVILLSKIPLHIAYPTLIGLNFLFITIGSWLLFREQFSFFQIAGVITIMMGIYLLSPKT